MRFLIATTIFISLCGATEAADLVSPNLFDCRAEQISCGGRALEISYSTSSITGLPLFGLQSGNGDKDLQVSGGAIKTQETAIGQLITIVTAPSHQVTLLIPKMNIRADQMPFSFETTVFKTARADGLTDFSIPVHCVGKLVAF